MYLRKLEAMAVIVSNGPNNIYFDLVKPFSPNKGMQNGRACFLIPFSRTIPSLNSQVHVDVWADV